MEQRIGKNITYYPLVENSGDIKINFYFFILPYLVLVCLLFNNKILFYIALVFAIPFVILLYSKQKSYLNNIKKWRVGYREIKSFTFNSETRMFDLNGLEVKSEDIERMKIFYNQPPEMEGFTGSLILMYFVNSNMEVVIKGGKIISIPLHSKKDIKSIVDTLSEFGINVLYDQHIYKFCNLH